MGTITPRTRKDKSTGYTAQIRLSNGGRVVYTESKTFDRRPAAEAWMKRREAELALPGALDQAAVDDPLLSKVIEKYTDDSIRELGRTKTQVLRTIKTMPIAAMRCSEIKSPHIVQFAQSLTSAPQTRGNYVSHLAAVFAIARPAWGYPLNSKEMDDARMVLQRLGIVSRSRDRSRRPTLEELDHLMEHFGRIRHKRSDSIPMQAIVAFAIFSTRRLEEIGRITWADLDVEGSRILVKDMKHPGEKIGSDVWCDLTPEALRIIQAQPKTANTIFTCGPSSVGASFTRAVAFLTIQDLHFHDMRHEGISRLFETGLSLPRVAAVSAHRTWASLKRYTHLRQTGDKYASWKWLDVIAPK